MSAITCCIVGLGMGGAFMYAACNGHGVAALVVVLSMVGYKMAKVMLSS